MTQLVKIKDVEILSGENTIDAKYNRPFEKIVISFLDDLSKNIRK